MHILINQSPLLVFFFCSQGAKNCFYLLFILAFDTAPLFICSHGMNWKALHTLVLLKGNQAKTGWHETVGNVSIFPWQALHGSFISTRI